jgi:hypothetical protein
VRRGLLVVVAATIVIVGIAIAVFAFPTRYGCGDDAGTFTTSQAVAEAACGSTATRFPTETAVVTDGRVLLRSGIAVAVLVALVVLFRLASRREADPELPDTWRPYG